MMERRPLSDFELSCIVYSQIELKKDPHFRQLNKLIDSGLKDASRDMADLCELHYEAGFWSGEAFLLEKLKRMANGKAKNDESEIPLDPS